MVPFPKVQTFSGMFWALPIHYSLYEKWLFFYLPLCYVGVYNKSKKGYTSDPYNLLYTESYTNGIQ